MAIKKLRRGRPHDKDVLVGALSQLKSQKTTKPNLRAALDWDEEKFDRILDDAEQNGLISIGPGRGAVVSLIKKPKAIKYRSEKELENDFENNISKFLEAHYGLDPRKVVSDNVAHGGRKDTGGRWTRPDVVAVMLDFYPHLFRHVLSIYSFELKYFNADKLQAVYEALAHKRFANYSFVALYRPKSKKDEEGESEEFSRMMEECNRLGIGLITFINANNSNTYKIRVQPKWEAANPQWQESFLKNNFGKKFKVLQELFEEAQRAMISHAQSVTPETLLLAVKKRSEKKKVRKENK